jgi:hypothetical protein
MKIARKMQCMNIQRMRTSWDYYASPSYLKYLVMNEVCIPSMRLYISPFVAEGIRPDMKAVWEGLGPGFAFAPSYPRSGGFATYLQDRCRDKESLQWQATLATFSPRVSRSMYEGFRDLLRHEMSKYTDDDFGTARFQMASQMRRYLAPSPLTVYANKVLPFNPCLSKALWDLAGAIPLSVTSGKKLYLRIFLERYPEAMQVAICTGGNLVSRKAFTPGLWTRATLDSLRRLSRYYWQRMPKLPGIGPAMGRLGMITQAESEHNALLDAVVQQIIPEHGDLNAETVRRFQQASPPYDWPTRLGRRMLFYWQTWRWVMEGRLTMESAETFPLNGGLKGNGRNTNIDQSMKSEIHLT